ncbi:MAG: hypothetical protein VX278_12060 [Myxococcota bacterium]|nr:hypothetical protein [Myxococcota bacterium]
MMMWVMLACGKPEFDDGWWQNESANPHPTTEGGEGGEGEGGEESGFFGILQTVGENLYEGESGVESDGCLWYSGIRGVEAEACSNCDFAVDITYSEIENIDDAACPAGFVPDEVEGTSVVLGFGGETVWRLNDDSWEEYAIYFQEGEYFGWYAPW